MTSFEFDICVVGGCGRAGLPLALAFAHRGLRVVAYDIDGDRVASVSAGQMPFIEEGADAALRSSLASGCLRATTDRGVVGKAEHVIVIVGTPVDEFLNPSMSAIRRCVDDIASLLDPTALVVLRSTVFPGTTEWVERLFRDHGLNLDVVFCPERIAEGKALEELPVLPQIIGADSPGARERARRLFGRLVPTLIDTSRKEAEVAKLLTNAWRYMKFAVANHFFMVAESAGLDYGRVLHAVRHAYPRAQDLPGPGFAAGPCLLKDTMQLAAFSQNNFMLGQAAMVVNEGLPAFIVDGLAKQVQLLGQTIGILGMAFKGGSDDTRASLSYKLRKLLQQRGARVLCTDPLVRDSDLVPLAQVLAQSEIIVIGAPHREYRGLDLGGRHIVDIWGLTSTNGALTV